MPNEMPKLLEATKSSRMKEQPMPSREQPTPTRELEMPNETPKLRETTHSSRMKSSWKADIAERDHRLGSILGCNTLPVLGLGM